MMAGPDTGVFHRVETKLDRLVEEHARTREQLATMAERFAPRADVGALSERVAVVESDARKLLGIVAAVGTIAAGAAATGIAQLFGG
jgi:uncharacterized protein YccT (UPF0319 family)